MDHSLPIFPICHVTSCVTEYYIHTYIHTYVPMYVDKWVRAYQARSHPLVAKTRFPQHHWRKFNALH